MSRATGRRAPHIVVHHGREGFPLLWPSIRVDVGRSIASRGCVTQKEIGTKGQQ